MQLKATATYEQATGRFTIWSTVDEGGANRLLYECVGYAGRGIGRNNPLDEKTVSRGPIPRGAYRVGFPFRHPRLGPIAFRLDAVGSAAVRLAVYGRSGFYIHGDNSRGDASHGCIVLHRQDRQAVLDYGVGLLEVVPGTPPQGGD